VAENLVSVKGTAALEMLAAAMARITTQKSAPFLLSGQS